MANVDCKAEGLSFLYVSLRWCRHPTALVKEHIINMEILVTTSSDPFYNPIIPQYSQKTVLLKHR